MTSKIVVGIDSSAPSRAAVAWGVSRARDTGSDLVLLHAVDHQFDPEASQEFTRAQLDDGQSLLADELALVREQYPRVSATLARTDPFTALVEASTTSDMVVIGTHKTGFIQGRSIGARFLPLASLSLCPVVFIPNVPLTSRRGVVVAVDDSPTGRRAVQLASREAYRLHQELTFLYSNPQTSASSTQHVDGQRVRRDRERAAATLASAAKSAQTGCGPVLTKTRLIRHGAAKELIDASLVSSLVVIAHPEARHVVGTAAGSLVHDALINLGGPTMIVPRVALGA